LATALPGGKRRKLTGGVLPNVAEDKIADEVAWTVRLAIDSLDLEDLE
jgi:hypothetical protein